MNDRFGRAVVPGCEGADAGSAAVDTESGSGSGGESEGAKDEGGEMHCGLVFPGDELGAGIPRFGLSYCQAG